MGLPDWIKENLVLSVLGLLFAGFSVGYSTHKALSEFPNLPFSNPKPPHSEVSIRALIDSSDLPMYLADKDLKIVYCNNYFSKFSGMGKEKILNSPIVQVAMDSIHLIAEQDRQRFKQDQERFAALAAAGKLPSAGEVYFFDMISHPIEDYRHKYEVWVHIDAIHTENGKLLGVLGLFRLKKI